MKKMKRLFIFLFAALVFATGCSLIPGLSNNTSNNTSSSDTKEYYDMSGVSFNGASYVYDGEEHSLSIEGTLPDGVSVMYLNNNKVNAGTYEVTAKFTGDTKNYYPIEDMKATLTIAKAGVSGISFLGDTVTYDGNPHSIEISGELPEGVLVTYSGNNQVNAGTYEVVANFTDTTGNYVELSPLKAILTINKATYDMSNIKFNSASYTYDGIEKEVLIDGELPSGVEVIYENNTLTNVGRVEATAIFKHNNPNYNDIPSKTATLTILRADIEGISFESKEVIYDGTSFSLKVKGNIPEGVKVTYTNNGHINVGTYEIIASFEDTTGNYNNLPDLKATLTINKATYDMSNISLNSASYTYDGLEKEVLIEGTLPNWINVTYINNKQTNAGSYEVTAIFTHSNSNYNDIPNMTTILTINKASIEGISFIGKTVTYNGSYNSIYISGYLPEGIEIEYSNNSQINAGEYQVVATFTDTTGNYIVPEPMTAILKINKLTIDVSLEDEIFSYDGEYHSLLLNGYIPEGITVNCSNNNFNKEGEYTVTYTFIDTTGNYNIVESLEATLTIVKDGKYHDVVFTFEDGTTKEYVIANGEVMYNIPKIPYKKGHTESWDNDTTLPITSDVVFNVEYTPNQYVITYNANGGELEETTQVVTYGEEFELYEATKVGYSINSYSYYIYSSWNTNEITSGIYLIDSDINVTINWNPNKYKVNYYDGETLLFSDDATYDSQYTYRSSYVNEEGLTLIKLYLNDEEFNPGTSIQNFTYLSDINIITKFYKIDSNYTYSIDWETESGIISGYNGIDSEPIIPEYVGSGNDYYKVASIGERAFYEYSSLTSITIPEGVTSIGYSAFENCSSLTGVYIDDIESWCNISFSNSYSNPLYYAKNLYLNNELVTELKIPEGVTSINGYAFYNCDSLTSVTIPEGVTSINGYAFYNCSSLTSIVIPEGVTSIGSSAFYDCSSLTSIVIPEGVTSIGSYAFHNCSSLTSITLPFVGQYADGSGKTHFGYIFGAYGNSYNEDCVPSSLKEVIITNCTSIGSYAFNGCSSLTSITIPETLTSIGSYAFYGCRSLTRVYIDDIESWCNISFSDFYSNPLYYAKNLYLNNKLVTKLVIPEGVTSIGSYAFHNCSSLTSITLPSTLTSIGTSAFYGCSSLTRVYIDDIESWCNIKFSNSTSNPLYYVKNLYLNNELVTELVIPEGVTSINDYAFYNCSSLTSITLPNTLTSIGYDAFRGCSSLTSIVIPEGVTSIGSSAFYDCSSLTSIVIPEGVTSIGQSAFRGCSSLTSITLPFVGQYADGSGKTYFGYIFGASSYSANSNYVPSNLKEVIITICTSINDYAFYNCSSLTSIVIPEGVTSIGEYAFYNCDSLTSVTIPEGVTSIGSYAFENCSSLTGVYIDDIESWCNISFSNSYSNPLYYAKNLYLNNELVTELTIPEGVTSIGSSLFNGCSSLTSMTLPEGVTSIGSYTFRGCSSLTGVYINDIESWCNISFNDDYSNPLYYADNLYLNGELVEDLVIPEGVEVINSYAFSSYSKIKTISFPDSLKTIQNIAFSSFAQSIYITNIDKWFSYFEENSNPFYNSKLYLNGELVEEVVIPSTITKIDSTIFNGLSEVKKLVIPSSVTVIEEGSLYNLTKLESLTLPFIGKINDSLIQNTELSLFGYIFGDNWKNSDVTQYYNEKNSVTYCISSSLKEVIIAGGDIYYGAFSGCSMIEKIVLPEGITTINSKVFSGCTKLKNIELPSSITTIKSYAFENCSSLEYLVLNSNLELIDTDTFKGCSKLKLFTELEEILNEWNCLGITVYTKDTWEYLDGKPIPSYYTITYDTQGGELEKYTNVVTYGEEITLPIPTKEGHIFQYWTLDGDIIDNTFTYAYLEDIVLVALWDDDLSWEDLLSNDETAYSSLCSKIPSEVLDNLPTFGGSYAFVNYDQSGILYVTTNEKEENDELVSSYGAKLVEAGYEAGTTDDGYLSYYIQFTSGKRNYGLTLTLMTYWNSVQLCGQFQVHISVVAAVSQVNEYDGGNNFDINSNWQTEAIFSVKEETASTTITWVNASNDYRWSSICTSYSGDISNFGELEYSITLPANSAIRMSIQNGGGDLGDIINDTDEVKTINGYFDLSIFTKEQLAATSKVILFPLCNIRNGIENYVISSGTIIISKLAFAYSRSFVDENGNVNFNSDKWYQNGIGYSFSSVENGTKISYDETKTEWGCAIMRIDGSKLSDYIKVTVLFTGTIGNQYIFKIEGDNGGMNMNEKEISSDQVTGTQQSVELDLSFISSPESGIKLVVFAEFSKTNVTGDVVIHSVTFS